MPRNKTSRKRAPDNQLLIFEIKDWEPSYLFSLNRISDRDGDYSEYAELHLDTVCVYFISAPRTNEIHKTSAVLDRLGATTSQACRNCLLAVDAICHPPASAAPTARGASQRQDACDRIRPLNVRAGEFQPVLERRHRRRIASPIRIRQSGS